MACPSAEAVTLFLANNDTGSVMGQIRDGGPNPVPQLVSHFQTCATSPNEMIPCPTDPNSPQSMNCQCAVGDAWLWDFTQLENGPQCKWWYDKTDAGALTTTDDVAYSIVMMHQATWLRILDLCNGDATLAEEVWPEFYHLYSTKYGSDQVEAFINAHPGMPAALMSAIRNNDDPEVQSLYGMLNGYDWVGSVGKYENFIKGSKFVAGWRDLFEAGYDLKKQYRRLPIFKTDFAKGKFGNPFWTPKEWQDNYRRAIGSAAGDGTIDNGKDFVDQWAQAYVNLGLVGPGKSADDYFDPNQHVGETNYTNNPYFQGNLPKKLPLDDLGEEYIHRETKDPTGHGYHTACGTEDITERFLPLLGGVVGGGVAAMIFPGQIAKVAAFGVGSFACYEVISSVYGQQALARWDTTLRNDGEKNAAVAISTGLPLCAVMSLSEMGWLPNAFASTGAQAGLVAASIGIGYFLLEKPLEDALIAGGDAAEIVLSPVSVATGIIHWMFDGCAAQQVHFDLKCYCQDSNDKPALAAAIIDDLYGATGNQAILRTECMQAAMTQGSWGTDPYYMGSCDGNGWMSTPAACVSAGEFVYKIWDPSIRDIVAPMRDEIKHCWQIDNPSFLEPQDETSGNNDGPCVQKYGRYARVASGTGNRPGIPGACYDYRAPPQNAQLGVPSSYDWSKLQTGNKSSECTIL